MEPGSGMKETIVDLDGQASDDLTILEKPNSSLPVENATAPIVETASDSGDSKSDPKLDQETKAQGGGYLTLANQLRDRANSLASDSPLRKVLEAQAVEMETQSNAAKEKAKQDYEQRQAIIQEKIMELLNLVMAETVKVARGEAQDKLAGAYRINPPIEEAAGLGVSPTEFIKEYRENLYNTLGVDIKLVDTQIAEFKDSMPIFINTPIRNIYVRIGFVSPSEMKARDSLTVCSEVPKGVKVVG